MAGVLLAGCGFPSTGAVTQGRALDDGIQTTIRVGKPLPDDS
ncbi:hypothetical protein [Streptomyces avermitilis]